MLPRRLATAIIYSSVWLAVVIISVSVITPETLGCNFEAGDGCVMACIAEHDDDCDGSSQWFSPGVCEIDDCVIGLSIFCINGWFLCTDGFMGCGTGSYC